MSKKEKLVARFQSLPRDFTWTELKTLLSYFGFEEISTGKTSGSRVRFYQENFPPIMLHKPHPEKILKLYQINAIKNYLENEGFL